MRLFLQCAMSGLLLTIAGRPLLSADRLPTPIQVFVAGSEEIDGVQNAAEKYPQYREPNVVVTDNGTVVVVCQGRNKSRWSDRSGQDLVAKTSDDRGATWSKGLLVATHGLKSICPNAAVYDRQTNRIHVLYNLFMWDYTSVPDDVRGEMGDLNCRQFVVTSDDEGHNWSEPREISHMVQTRGAVMVVGSGEGIQLEHGNHKGRLIIAGGDFYQGKKVLCFYSDDHGQTWQRSNVVPFEGKMSWASESKVAQLPDGTLVLNSRTHVADGPDGRRRTRAFSSDGGHTWTQLENDPALKTVSCNGSLIAVAHPKGKDGTILLCSLPAGPRRTHGSVYVSFDGGRTWPHRKLVVPGAFAYSSLIELPDGRIGLFYESEGYARILLVRFSLSWLLESGHSTQSSIDESPAAEEFVNATSSSSFEGCARGEFTKVESSIGLRTAEITGNNSIAVSSPRVADPRHVRYSWTPYSEPPVNLFNRSGLPASPFTTQDEGRFAPLEAAEDERPNILLIVGEDHGCELSCYGDPVIETPNIDRLASEGVLFEHGYVTQTVCSPSRSTIFTGLYPHQNGQLGLATHQYGWFKRFPTTYSILKRAGSRSRRSRGSLLPHPRSFALGGMLDRCGTRGSVAAHARRLRPLDESAGDSALRPAEGSA